MVSFVAVGLLALLFSAVNAGSLVLSNTLGSNMVLQRAPAAANIWGWATPSETVSVDVQGPTSQTQQATAASDGSWLVSLTPTNAGGPYTITVASSDGEKLQLTNVLFGDVWICGGQSNMEFTVACGFNATAEIQAANNYPNIRIFTVGDYHYSSTPLAQLNQTLQPWSVASNTTVGLGEWNAFSAVCWFTGRDLYDQYQVPLGLISSNWGGTVVQAWSSPTALKACNITTSGTGNEANSVLYNAMIVPFLNQVIKGALWYQGEQNAGQAPIYNCAFPAMIADWRANWAPASGKEFPFLFVQLAATIAGSGSGWADTRQAQFDASLVLDNVGFATAVDLGDPTSPFGNVHPRDKQDVGKRLALAARNIAYGETDVVWQGPTFVSWTSSISGNTAEAVVTFKTWGASGLVAREAYCPTNESVPLNNCGGWNILLSNNQWYNATQTVSGNTVTATVTDIPSGTTVTGVSYAYASWPQCTIYSQEGLPAIPFRYPPNIVPPTNF